MGLTEQLVKALHDVLHPRKATLARAEYWLTPDLLTAYTIRKSTPVSRADLIGAVKAYNAALSDERSVSHVATTDASNVNLQLYYQQYRQAVDQGTTDCSFTEWMYHNGHHD